MLKKKVFVKKNGEISQRKVSKKYLSGIGTITMTLYQH